MVMAGNESTPGTLANNGLCNTGPSRLQWLRQRREALQEKLAQKNNELKNLCIEEAEITGVLPPEIPLEPGESPPAFRRKTNSFIYPQKLINKLKTTDTEESELELERQVQLGIVEAALGVVNDPTESKATRRKHRLAYQQSQRRIQELDIELNFIRQSRGKTHRQSTQLLLGTQGSYNTQPHSHVNVKHRTKKPRPPLDSTGNEIISKSPGKGVLQETGISLSPLGPEDKSVTYTGHGYEEQFVPTLYNHHHHHHSSAYPGVNPVDQTNIKIVEHDHNDNHNVYILPDQYHRTRTYSHGSGGSRIQREHYQDSEKPYRLYVPNTYTDDERQIRYRQFLQQQQHIQKQQQQLQEQIQNHRLQYGSEYKHLDNADIIRRTSQGSYERDFRVNHYMPITDYQIYYKNSTQSQSLQKRSDRDSSLLSGNKNLRQTSTSASIETQLPAGYWVRQDDEIVWVSMDEPVSVDRFGSLDRRRRNAQHNGNVGTNSDMQSRYRTVAVTGTKNSGSSNVAISSSHQHHSVHLLPLSEHQMPVNNKMLLRTQSLGSVETWQSNHSHDSHDGKDGTAIEYTNRKSRQKEWYETSLDSGTSVGLDHNLIGTHYQASPPPARTKNVSESAKDNAQIMAGSMSPLNHHKKLDRPEERQHTMQQPHARYDQPAARPKVLEIPAESKPSHDVCDDTIRPPLGSPQNCTVVQAGKYQPYREVTKPFEMSDFYKYSTKFRKRNEAMGQFQLGNDLLLQENRPECAGMNDLSKDPNLYDSGKNDAISASPVQRKIYQPVQRMTCQPYFTSLR